MVSGFKIYLKSCQLPSLLVTNKKKKKASGRIWV